MGGMQAKAMEDAPTRNKNKKVNKSIPRRKRTYTSSPSPRVNCNPELSNQPKIPRATMIKMRSLDRETTHRTLLREVLVKCHNKRHELLLKPGRKKTGSFKSKTHAGTSKTPETTKAGTKCLRCGKVFTDDADFQIHVVAEHPHANLNETTSRT